MTEAYLYALGGVAIVSAISFIGALALAFNETMVRKHMFLFISLAVGALMGDALIHLIPEALEESSNPLVTSLWVIGGVALFFVLEKFLHWHHHGEDVAEAHPVGKLVLVSDGAHNFVDGMLIAASFFVSIPVGIATTVAVVLHEIPQEIGDFAVLLHAGYTRRKALWMNFLSALTAVLGAVVFFIIGESIEASTAVFLPLTAGGFLYIAMTDLTPELHKTKGGAHSVIQLLAVAAGVAAMVALAFLE